jgi:hypothetical protein
MELSDTVTRDIRRHKRAVAHRLMDFPTPDYSKIPPKVNIWRSKPKFGGKYKKVLARNDILATENQQDNSRTINMWVTHLARAISVVQSFLHGANMPKYMHFIQSFIHKYLNPSVHTYIYAHILIHIHTYIHTYGMGIISNHQDSSY